MNIKQEQLISVLDDEDGCWHAIYPSARRTLCGIVPSRLGQPGRRYPWTCVECVRVARVFHRIDRVSGRRWLRPALARVFARAA